MWGVGCGVWGLGFGFEVWDLGFGVWGMWCGYWGVGFGGWDLGCWGSGLEWFRASKADWSPANGLMCEGKSEVEVQQDTSWGMKCEDGGLLES